jgi:CheR methyltransferase, SAM binding domain/CheB methylesterase/PAS domain
LVLAPPPAGHHLPIDYFLPSLAETMRSQAIGVVLSGTASDSDGTAGQQAIKAEGGITFAEEPASAKYDGMPRNAIVAGCVDFVLPPERIAAEFARIARHPFVTVSHAPDAEVVTTNEEDWVHQFRLLRDASGVEISPSRRKPPSDAASRSGVYSEQELRDLSPQRRHRFFTQVDGHYSINAAIRELCVFARHDVTKDPPFSRLDLLSCRNLSIYLEPNLQRRVLASFHYMLKNSGMLFLGKSESLGSFADFFTVADPKNKFFTGNIGSRVPIEVIQPSHEMRSSQGKASADSPRRLDLEKDADRILWERYALAGIVVDDKLQILHFRGNTSPYLQPAPGRAPFSWSRMLREDLQLELRAAVQEARKSGRSVRRESIPIKSDRQECVVNLEIRPLPGLGRNKKCFLILFEDAGPRSTEPSKPAPGKREGKAERQRERFNLDSDCRIRRFTPPARQLLGLLPGDIGRPIRHVRFGLDIPDLAELLTAATENGVDVQ